MNYNAGKVARGNFKMVSLHIYRRFISYWNQCKMDGGCLITDSFILSGFVTVDGIPQIAFSFNHWVQHPRTRYQSHLILTRPQKILSVKTTDVKDVLLLLRDQFNRLVCRQYYYTVKYERLFQIQPVHVILTE